MTISALAAFSPHAVPFQAGLAQACELFGIDTPLRQAHLLAQLAHESQDFTRLEENLNYSAERLLIVYPKYFPSRERAMQYARKPQAIANRVYGGRHGNGPEGSGDGWTYRGRGFIHLTFRGNYAAARDGITRVLSEVPDFERLPDLAAQPMWAALIAGWYWRDRNCNHDADADDVRAVTRLVNGGENGLRERKELLAKAKACLGA